MEVLLGSIAAILLVAFVSGNIITFKPQEKGQRNEQDKN